MFLKEAQILSAYTLLGQFNTSLDNGLQRTIHIKLTHLESARRIVALRTCRCDHTDARKASLLADLARRIQQLRS